MQIAFLFWIYLLTEMSFNSFYSLCLKLTDENET